MENVEEKCPYIGYNYTDIHFIAGCHKGQGFYCTGRIDCPTRKDFESNDKCKAWHGGDCEWNSDILIINQNTKKVSENVEEIDLSNIIDDNKVKFRCCICGSERWKELPALGASVWKSFFQRHKEYLGSKLLPEDLCLNCVKKMNSGEKK